MSYLVIARKYRPPGFEQVVGQDHVTRALQNSIRRNRIGHAYLLAGPRGVGKTSIARIFSRALNCGGETNPTPCLKCNNCLEITKGASLAVREIDGASHNSVDNVRELIDSFRSLPPSGYRYKVYIIDEVHMLSVAAFNALLKSLEEPPPNTVFILATTEVHKIPETVLSRCQRYDLRALPAERVMGQLREILEGEGLKSDEESLRLLARASEGSMRDAQSLLERVISYCEGEITATETSRVLGVIERAVLFQMSQAILSRDSAKALSLVADVFDSGIDPSVFLREFVTHFRGALISRFASDEQIKVIGMSTEEVANWRTQLQGLSVHDLEGIVSMSISGADHALRSYHTRYAIEALVVRMANRERGYEVAELLGRLSVKAPGAVKTPGADISSGADRGSGVRPAANMGTMGSSASSQALSSSTRGPTSVDIQSEALQSQANSLQGDRAVSQKVVGSASGADNQLQYNQVQWPNFIEFLAGQGGRLLCEQLRRCRVKNFNYDSSSSQGILELEGGDFSISYLKQEANRKRLTEGLVEFVSGSISGSKWRVDLSAVQESADKPIEGTLRAVEEAQQAQIKVDRVEAARSHPTVTSLQKLFPGSTIDEVRLKEE